MAQGDISFFDAAVCGLPGAAPVAYAVASGTTASINAFEPVAATLGGAAVATLATAKPVVGTDFLAGISTSISTETASAAGVVFVMPLIPGVKYLCAPAVAATWDTQTEYNALVGDRVVFDKTNGVYTVLATDGSTNGLVVEPLDIKVFPGKVCFSLRAALSYAA